METPRQQRLKGPRRRRQVVLALPPDRRASRPVKRGFVSRLARPARVGSISPVTAPVILASNAVPPPPLPPPPLHPQPAPHRARRVSAKIQVRPVMAARTFPDIVRVIVVSSVVLIRRRSRRRRQVVVAGVDVRGRLWLAVRGWRGGCWLRVEGCVVMDAVSFRWLYLYCF